MAGIVNAKEFLPGSISNDRDNVVALTVGLATVTWDRDALIRRLAGTILRKMQMSGPALFLYAEEQPILCFSVMRNKATEKLLLFWEESD